MKRLTIEIPEKHYRFFLELMQSLGFVKRIEEGDTEIDLKQELQQAVAEMKAIKAGKLKGRPIESLLDEI